jgi:glycosyltransferase involved in cell wall biosynthesis
MILTVVIPTRDKRPLLERTLAALRAQDVGDQAWEIVVVNDGSADDTAATLARLAAEAGPPLRVVSPPRNVGRAAARNLGWRQASGSWVLFLDDDIVAPPGLLAAHLAALGGDVRRGTIGPAVTDPTIVDAPHFYYLDSRGVAKLAGGVAPARYFVTQNAAVPREALVAVGGFDEGFSAYGFEDMDLGFRLERWGVRFQVLPLPVPRHIHHHTLSEYLQKKRVCGRHSLREIAQRHPDRLREMRLDLVLDPAGGRRPDRLARTIRVILDGPLGAATAKLVRRWPVGAGFRPRASWLYMRLMDLVVLRAYRQGLRDDE